MGRKKNHVFLGGSSACASDAARNASSSSSDRFPNDPGPSRTSIDASSRLDASSRPPNAPRRAGWWFVDGTLVARRYLFAARGRDYHRSRQTTLAQVCTRLWALKLLANACDAELFIVFDDMNNADDDNRGGCWRRGMLKDYKSNRGGKDPERELKEKEIYAAMMKRVRRQFLVKAGIPYLDTPRGLEGDDALAVLSINARMGVRRREERKRRWRGRQAAAECSDASGRRRDVTKGDDNGKDVTKEDDNGGAHRALFPAKTPPKVVVLTADKDLWQLHQHGVDVLDPFDLTWLTPQLCLEKFSVLPQRIGEFLAINGDSADDVPKGAKGWGPKTIGSLFADLDPSVTLLELVSLEGRAVCRGRKWDFSDVSPRQRRKLRAGTAAEGVSEEAWYAVSTGGEWER